MTKAINPTLLDMAEWKLRTTAEKVAFVPTDPAAAGGAPPMDPAMGGAPPMDPAMGGAPPMDPAMMGGAPPMDPAMMGGAPPMAPPAAPPAPGAAPAGPGGTTPKPKIEPTFIYMELSRVRKLLTHLLQSSGIDLPPDILDDGAVAQQFNGTPPESQAIGAETPPAAPAGPPSLPGIGGESAISPISAPGEKQGSVQSLFKAPVPQDESAQDFTNIAQRLDALAALSRSRVGG